MPKQIDWTQAENREDPRNPKRSRKPAGRGARRPAKEEAAPEGGEALASGAGGETAAAGEAAIAFENVEQLEKKGLRVLPVVTGAVVDDSGSFLFYVDGHEDSRSAVQAQINHLLRSGPSREEHLARARARAQYLGERLSQPR